MTIPTPAFTLVDECPGWCTMDHMKVYSNPGDHETKLAEFSHGDGDFALYASGHSGLQVKMWHGGEEALVVPAAVAVERLIELARAALTAVNRLRVIEAAEKSVSGSTNKEPVVYSLEFPAELLPRTPSTLRLVNI